jgi:hypothetical protein
MNGRHVGRSDGGDYISHYQIKTVFPKVLALFLNITYLCKNGKL